jgi:hypothetical protein
MSVHLLRRMDYCSFQKEVLQVGASPVPATPFCDATSFIGCSEIHFCYQTCAVSDTHEVSLHAVDQFYGVICAP